MRPLLIFVLLCFCGYALGESLSVFYIDSSAVANPTSCGNFSSPCSSMALAVANFYNSSSTRVTSSLHFMIISRGQPYSTASNCFFDIANVPSVVISGLYSPAVFTCPQDLAWNFHNISALSLANLTIINSTCGSLSLMDVASFSLSDAIFNCTAPFSSSVISMKSSNSSVAGSSSSFIRVQLLSEQLPVPASNSSFFSSIGLQSLFIADSNFNGSYALSQGFTLLPPSSLSAVSLMIQNSHFMSFFNGSLEVYQAVSDATVNSSTFTNPYGRYNLGLLGGVLGSATISNSTFRCPSFGITVLKSLSPSSSCSFQGLVSIINSKFYPSGGFPGTVVWPRALVYLHCLDSVFITDVLVQNDATNGAAATTTSISHAVHILNVSRTISIQNSQFLDLFTISYNNIHSALTIQDCPGNVVASNLTFAGISSDRSGSSFIISDCFLDSISISNCHFRNNSSPNGQAGLVIRFAKRTADIQIFNSSFSRNQSPLSFGAGLFTVGVSPIVSNCSFSNNLALQGGAVFIQSPYSYATLQNCVFENNQAMQGGAVFANGFSALITANNTFLRNSANIDGGAIYMSQSTLYDSSNHTWNSAGRYGGSIFLDPSSNGVLGRTANRLDGTLSCWSASHFQSSNAAMGGAIYNEGNLWFPVPAPSCTGSAYFQRNNASFGAALALGSRCFSQNTASYAQATVSRFYFEDNAAVIAGNNMYYADLTNRCWDHDFSNISTLQAWSSGQRVTSASDPFANVCTGPAYGIFYQVNSSSSTVSFDSSTFSIRVYPSEPFSVTMLFVDALGQFFSGQAGFITTVPLISAKRCTTSAGNTCSGSPLGSTDDLDYLEELAFYGYPRPPSNNLEGVVFDQVQIQAPPGATVNVSLTLQLPNDAAEYVLGEASTQILFFTVTITECPVGSRSTNSSQKYNCLPCSSQEYNLNPGSQCIVCGQGLSAGTICDGYKIYSSVDFWAWTVLGSDGYTVQASHCPVGNCIGTSYTVMDNMPHPPPAPIQPSLTDPLNSFPSLVINHCAPNRDSSWPFCGKCVANFSEWFGICIPCTEVSIPHIFGLIGMAFVYAFFSFAISYSPHAASRPHVRILISYFQIVDLITHNTQFATGHALVSSSNFDLTKLLSTKSTCPFPTSGYLIISLNIFSFLIVLSALIILILCMRLSLLLSIKYFPRIRYAVTAHKYQRRLLHSHRVIELVNVSGSDSPSTAPSHPASLASSLSSPLAQHLLQHDHEDDREDGNPQQEIAAPLPTSQPLIAADIMKSEQPNLTNRQLLGRVGRLMNQVLSEIRTFLKVRLFNVWVASYSFDSIVRTAVQIVLLAFQRICGYSFAFAATTPVGEHRYGVFFPDISSSQPEFVPWAVFFGMIIVASFFFPFMLYKFLCMYHKSTAKVEPSQDIRFGIFARDLNEFNSRFSGLWSSFGPQFFYWNCVILFVRCLLLAANTVGIDNAGSFPFLRIALIGIVLAASWSIESHYMPYAERLANQLSSAVNAALVLILGLTATFNGALANGMDRNTIEDAFRGCVIVISVALVGFGSFGYIQKSLKSRWLQIRQQRT